MKDPLRFSKGTKTDDRPVQYLELQSQIIQFLLGAQEQAWTQK